MSPFWSHAAQIWLLTELPEWAVEMVTLSLHMGIRSAGDNRYYSFSFTVISILLSFFESIIILIPFFDNTSRSVILTLLSLSVIIWRIIQFNIQFNLTIATTHYFFLRKHYFNTSILLCLCIDMFAFWIVLNECLFCE